MNKKGRRTACPWLWQLCSRPGRGSSTGHQPVNDDETCHIHTLERHSAATRGETRTHVIALTHEARCEKAGAKGRSVRVRFCDASRTKHAHRGWARGHQGLGGGWVVTAERDSFFLE